MGGLRTQRPRYSVRLRPRLTGSSVPAFSSCEQSDSDPIYWTPFIAMNRIKRKGNRPTMAVGMDYDVFNTGGLL